MQERGDHRVPRRRRASPRSRARSRGRAGDPVPSWTSFSIAAAAAASADWRRASNSVLRLAHGEKAYAKTDGRGKRAPLRRPRNAPASTTSPGACYHAATERPHDHAICRDLAAATSATRPPVPTDGFPVILAHGWPDDVRTWDAVLPALHRSGLSHLRAVVARLRADAVSARRHVSQRPARGARPGPGRLRVGARSRPACAGRPRLGLARSVHRVLAERSAASLRASRYRSATAPTRPGRS